MLVSQVLGPSLVLLRCLTKLPTEKRQGLSETVRIEIRKARRRERLLEDRPDGTGVAPVFAVLLDMERLEVLVPRIGFEPGNRLRHRINGLLAVALSLGEKGKVVTLHPLVCGVVVR